MKINKMTGFLFVTLKASKSENLLAIGSHVDSLILTVRLYYIYCRLGCCGVEAPVADGEGQQAGHQVHQGSRQEVGSQESFSYELPRVDWVREELCGKVCSRESV